MAEPTSKHFLQSHAGIAHSVYKKTFPNTPYTPDEIFAFHYGLLTGVRYAFAYPKMAAWINKYAKRMVAESPTWNMGNVDQYAELVRNFVEVWNEVDYRKPEDKFDEMQEKYFMEPPDDIGESVIPIINSQMKLSWEIGGIDELRSTPLEDS